MEELLGETISSCVRCHDWFTNDRHVPYEEKMHIRAENNHWAPETLPILCARCYSYCARRYVPHTGKQTKNRAIELEWLARILGTFPDVGKVIVFLQAGYKGNVVLGSKLKELVQSDKGEQMFATMEEKRLESLALAWQQTDHTTPIRAYLVKKGKMDPDVVAGFNGEIDTALSDAQLFLSVQRWYEGEAFDGVQLADFCVKNGIPVDETRDDRLTPEVRATLSKLTTGV
jgi:hypothetical protein